MIDNINALQTSWYFSPPWGQTIPPVEVNLTDGTARTAFTPTTTATD